MANSVIALSRQRGSGGDAIAALVAQELGVPLYDQHVLARAAAQVGVSEQAAAAAEIPQGFFTRLLENLGQTALYAPDVPAMALPPPFLTSLMVTRADIRAGIEQVIRALADRGPAVIVGHAAGQVALRDRRDVLRVFIHAPVEQRVQRMMTYGRLSRAEAEQDVQQRDEERATFFQRNYDLDWYNLRLYDLVLNAGERPYAKVAATICQVARG